MSTWRPFGAPGSDEPKRVSESLRRVAAHLGAPDPDTLGVVFSHWEETVGPGLADHTRPVSLSGDSLVVEVSESAWATQIRFLEADLLARLAEVAGRPVAARIEVRVRPAGGSAGRGQPGVRRGRGGSG